MRKGKLAILVRGEQLKTILYSVHHMLAPYDYLGEEDRELVEMLERLHEEMYPKKYEVKTDKFAIDDLPF